MWRISQQFSRSVVQRTQGGFISTTRDPAVATGVGHAHQLVSVRCQSKSASDTAQESTTEATPPPPPRSGGGGWFWKLLGLTVVSTGGIVGYAWYDAGFRQSLEQNVPYSKEALNLLFQYVLPLPAVNDTQAKKEGGKGGITETKPQSQKRLITESTSQSKSAPISSVPSPLSPTSKTPTAVASGGATSSPMKTSSQDSAEKKRLEKERAEQILRDQEQRDIVENRELEFLLDKLVGDSTRTVEAAVTSFKNAAQAIRSHTQQLKHAMESSSNESEWEIATEAHQLRSDAIWASDTAQDRAKITLAKLETTVADGKSRKTTKKNKSLYSSEAELNKLNSSLSAAAADLSKAQSEAKIFGEYRDLVKKGKEQFRKELESIQPDVKLGEKKGKLTEEELNLLIGHAHRRIEQLQRQLAGHQALEQQRVDAALDRQRQEDEKLAAERILRESVKMKAELELEKQKWDADAAVEFEAELRSQLARLAAAHSEHIIEVLKVQEKELDTKCEVNMADRVSAERANFERQISGYVSRVHGIEQNIEVRADLEKKGRRARELWLACQSLEGAVLTSSGLPAYRAEEYESQLKPLSTQIVAVREAGDGNPFVSTILSSIPESAIHRGVWTEPALVERFWRVATVGRRVAMIDESDTSLFRYFLSYLQSKFVIKSATIVPSRDSLISVADMDTFALLDNAGACLERGDLEQAVRYVNALRGEPRRAAKDWLIEARLLLETRQATDALLAFSTAAGLATIF